jgi:hypothetical protein
LGVPYFDGVAVEAETIGLLKLAAIIDWVNIGRNFGSNECSLRVGPSVRVIKNEPAKSHFCEDF